MQYRAQGRGNVRTVVAATAVVVAALALTACQPGDDGGAAAGAPSRAPVASAASSPAVSSPAASSPASGAPVDAPKTCAADALEASARQADERPDGTGTGAAVVGFTNVSGKACVLNGHPSVAGAGNGSPEHSSPLAVTPKGTGTPVTLAPGGQAWVKLTFVQVQGEGDGYCASGAEPVVYPTLVVALPGAGAHQVALEDGRFAECDDKVTVTAVSAARPS
ncbi:DUF4232 domain-containing protein [Streptomyces sp. NPDC086787]|uniref:DUF4232 domain-containing protein n=1 Tax=Streptomyces sp. NPDC086787 TaxID=3365759 RepID=UPI003814ED2B